MRLWSPDPSQPGCPVTNYLRAQISLGCVSWSTHLPLEHPPAHSPSSAVLTSHPGFKSSVQSLPHSSFRLPLNSQHIIEQTLNSHQRVCLCCACFCHCAESLQQVSTAVHCMSQHPAHNSLYKNDCWMKEQLSSSVHACCHWLNEKGNDFICKQEMLALALGM